MSKRHVKPAKPGAIVRYPGHANVALRFQQLPPEGAAVDWTTYWMRRLQFGDVVLVSPSEIRAAAGAKQLAVEDAAKRAPKKKSRKKKAKAEDN